MPKEGSNAFYRAYADRWYLDKANKDNYLYRSSASKIGLSGGLVVPDLETLDGVDLSVHAADLAAHTRHVSEIMRTGEYIETIPTESSDMSGTLTANRLYATPFLVPRNLTIDYAAFRLTTGIDGKVARIGIYADGTNCYPGALVEDWGEVAVAIANQGTITVNIADRALTKGLYWIAIVSNAAIVMTHIRPSPLILGQATTFGNPQMAWYVAHVYGALPDPFTAGGSMSMANTPMVLPRLKSLD